SATQRSGNFARRKNNDPMILKTCGLAAATLIATLAHEPLPNLPLGTFLPAPGQKMMDVSGKETNLKDLLGNNGLLVIFTCNTCPFVIGSEGSAGWEGRYPEIAAFAQQHGMGVAFINSNEAKRNDGDGFADMQARYKEKSYAGHYLLDKDHKVADAFGARTTPHVFLFNNELKLAYKGAIDDNVGDPAAVTQHWLKDAITDLSKGQAVRTTETRNIGCSIKRMPHQH